MKDAINIDQYYKGEILQELTNRGRRERAMAVRSLFELVRSSLLPKVKPAK